MAAARIPGHVRARYDVRLSAGAIYRGWLPRHPDSAVGAVDCLTGATAGVSVVQL